MIDRVCLGAIWIYQATVAPLLGPCCRFEPSCSAYTAEAIRRHGCRKGIGLGIRRVIRCRPGHPGGHDPVPQPNALSLRES